MPINPEHKVLFIHIPKTAGSSIEIFFQMQREERYYCSRPRHLIDTVKYAPQHFTGRIMKERFPHFDSYFKFCFVRNPYDRVLSEYYFMHRRKGIEFFNDPTNFKRWVFSYLNKEGKKFMNCYCHKIEQYRFVYDEDGNQIIDFIGKFENLQEDFTKLLDIIGYTGEKTLVKSQTAKFKKNENLLTYPVRERIREVYYEDFKLFNYEM